MVNAPETHSRRETASAGPRSRQPSTPHRSSDSEWQSTAREDTELVPWPSQTVSGSYSRLGSQRQANELSAEQQQLLQAQMAQAERYTRLQQLTAANYHTTPAGYAQLASYVQPDHPPFALTPDRYGSSAAAAAQWAAYDLHRQAQAQGIFMRDEYGPLSVNAHPGVPWQQPSSSITPVHAVRQPRQEPHHRVYVLRCAHCNTFFSDRGMRAVLLLKPHVTLFSTDTSPSNAGPLYGSQDQEPEPPADKLERTCECLTQSLGCHCCGNVVGYQIIAPCLRCTASVTRHHRPANGHRYVFHHNEIVAAERKHRLGEAGLRTDLVRHVPHAERGQLQSAREAEALLEQQAQTDTDDEMPALESLDADVKDSPVTARVPRPLLTRAASAPRSSNALQEGHTIYWHYLLTGGEIAKPVDPLTRAPSSFAIGR